MKILTTNSSGKDRFGGIHTRKMAHIGYSPKNFFYVLELNSEKKYISKKNFTIQKIDNKENLNGKNIFECLNESNNLKDFEKKVEKVVNQFQNAISSINPDIIEIPGTSLNSFCLFKACRREGVLNKTIQEYAGVLEKEIGGYSGDTRYILEQIGKFFVSDTALENMTYLFPSEICKKEVEKIHNLKIPKPEIIWNGVSEEFNNRNKKRRVPNKLTLGYIGRIHHVKNLPFFLGLNENLRKKAKLKIITDLDSASSKNEGKILLKKMTEGEVLFYAPMKHSRLRDFYKTQLSAGVVSSFFETYCNGAVESLVCGTPTILSDRAGAREVYNHYGLENLVFSLDRFSSFEKALDSAKKMNFKINEKLSQGIYGDLCWEKVIKKYNKLIEKKIKE